MTVRPASRRLLVGGTSAALLLGVVGFVPLLGSASAACAPTYTDPAGDAVLVADGAAVPFGPDLGNDADLDIVDVTHTVDAGAFRSVVHLAKLEDYGPQVSFMDSFQTHFTVNGKAVDVEVERDHNTDPETVTGLLTVAGTDTTVTVKATVDLKASTVTAEIAVPAFEGALGGSLTGKSFSAMTATSIQVFEAFGFGGPRMNRTMDTATAPSAATYAFGASCSGGSVTPEPSGSATAAPTPSGSATPSPGPSPTSSIGPDGLFDQPRKGCATFTDAAGDADPTGIGEFNEGSLDVTGVNLKSPAGALQVYVKLADAGEALYEMWSGRVYDVSLTLGGKTVVLSAPGEGPATATVGGTENKDVKATAKVDVKNSNLVFTVPLEGLSKAVATTITAGTAITGTAIATAADSELGAQEADSAAGTKPEEKTYSYGDNTCFKPPVGKLVVDADPRGQYGDKTVLFGTLTDTDDVPVQGVKLTAVLTRGKAVSAVTDVDGVAEFRLPLAVPAGAKALSVSFAGNTEVGAVTKTVPFSVVAEKVLLKAAGVRGGAKAVLVDDDRHAVAGQVVTFTVGSKKYSVRTNSKGIAVLSRIAKGSVIKVRYSGSRNYFLATPTATVKAG